MIHFIPEKLNNSTKIKEFLLMVMQFVHLLLLLHQVKSILYWFHLVRVEVVHCITSFFCPILNDLSPKEAYIEIFIYMLKSGLCRL